MNKQLFTTKIAFFVLAFAGQQLLGSTAKPTPPTAQSATTLATILLDYAVRNTDTDIVSINFDDNEDRATEERIVALTNQLSTMSMRQAATEQHQLRPSQQQIAAETKKVELKEAKQPETMAVTTNTKQSQGTKLLTFDDNTKGLGALSPQTNATFILDDEKFPSVSAYFEAQRFACAPRLYKLFMNVVVATSVREIKEIVNTNIPNYINDNELNALYTTLTSLTAVPSTHDLSKLLQNILAQHERGKQRKEWTDVKIPLMRRALRAQINQHATLQKVLLSTGECTLNYQSPDTFWGVSSNGKGENNLGKLLMEIRTEIANGIYYHAKG